MQKEATLKVGNSKEIKLPIKEIVDAIMSIFDSGFKNRMEQSTIQVAIQTFGTMAKVEKVDISNNIFKGDKTINMNDDEEKI